MERLAGTECAVCDKEIYKNNYSAVILWRKLCDVYNLSHIKEGLLHHVAYMMKQSELDYMTCRQINLRKLIYR